MNYKIGEDLWSSSKRTHQRLNGGRPALKIKSVELNSTLEKLSSSSSFQSVLVRKRKTGPNLSILEPRKKLIKFLEKNETSILIEPISTVW
jgi:hypothetical protein